MDTTNTLTTTNTTPAPPAGYTTEIERDPRLKSAHTRRQYRAALGTFEAWRNGRIYSRTLVEEYAADLHKAGKSPDTIKQAIAVIKWWIRRCIELAHEQLPREQAEEFEYKVSRILAIEEKAVAKGKRLPAGRHVEIFELTALLEACVSDPSPAGVRDTAMFGIVSHTATRNEELRAITIADITYTQSGADIKIQHGKGDKAREISVDGDTLAALNAWIDLRGVAKGPLFCPIRRGGNIAAGHPISYEATRQILYKRFIQSTLSKSFTWHDFRRTVVGMLFDNGVDVSTAMGITGHVDAQTIMKYDRRPANRRKEALQGISIPYKSVE